jgi:GNAT superfamily N-acetyltransferase
MAETPQIRPAEPGEGQQLSALALRSKALWGYPAEFLEASRAELTVSEAQITAGQVFVAAQGAAVVGFSTLIPSKDCLWVDLLFVEPAAARRGVGRALWEHAVEQARRLGLHTLRVQSDPNAEAFYRRMGAEIAWYDESAIQAGRRLPVLEYRLK